MKKPLRITHCNSLMNINNRITFLDIIVDANSDDFITSLNEKPPNKNLCFLNYKSECPHRYKIGIIKKMINHAKMIYSLKILFYKGLSSIKQTCINNNFPSYVVEEINWL